MRAKWLQAVAVAVAGGGWWWPVAPRLPACAAPVPRSAAHAAGRTCPACARCRRPRSHAMAAVVWQCDAGKGKWSSYSADVTEKLEQGHASRSKVTWTHRKQSYEVDFSVATPPQQVNAKTKKSRAIRRLAAPPAIPEATPPVSIGQGWECLVDGGKWAPYPDAVCQTLHAGEQARSKVSFSLKGAAYEVDFGLPPPGSPAKQINVSTQVAREIRRVPVVQQGGGKPVPAALNPAWECAVDGGQWSEYSAEISRTLEAGHANSAKVSFNFRKGAYEVDFTGGGPTFQQINVSSQFAREVRRKSAAAAAAAAAGARV